MPLQTSVLVFLAIVASFSGCRCATPETAACASASNCPAGYSCTAGKCACPVSQLLCGGRDICPAADPLNCGACGVACPSTQSCESGRCESPVPDGGPDVDGGPAPDGGIADDGGTDAGACGEGLLLCRDAGCVNPVSDIDNCGACGWDCEGTGSYCDAGVCQCRRGEDLCAFSCIDPSTANTSMRCGVCFNACGGDESCDSGTCCVGDDCSPPLWSCASLLQEWTGDRSVQPIWYTAQLEQQILPLGSDAGLSLFAQLYGCVQGCVTQPDASGCFAQLSNTTCSAEFDACRNDGTNCAQIIECVDRIDAGWWNYPTADRCTAPGTRRAQTDFSILAETANNHCGGDAGCAQAEIDGGSLSSAWQSCQSD